MEYTKDAIPVAALPIVAVGFGRLARDVQCERHPGTASFGLVCYTLCEEDANGFTVQKHRNSAVHDDWRRRKGEHEASLTSAERAFKNVDDGLTSLLQQEKPAPTFVVHLTTQVEKYKAMVSDRKVALAAVMSVEPATVDTVCWRFDAKATGLVTTTGPSIEPGHVTDPKKAKKVANVDPIV